MTPAVSLEEYPPVFVSTFLRPLTDDDFRAYLAGISRVYDRHGRLVFVVDASHMPRLAPEHRTMLAAWFAEYEQRIRRQCVGTALVFPSAISRFILSTVLLIRPFPGPYEVCMSRAEALVKVRAWLRGAGMDADASLRRASEAGLPPSSERPSSRVRGP
jgi:hypothetical protein